MYPELTIEVMSDEIPSLDSFPMKLMEQLQTSNGEMAENQLELFQQLAVAQTLNPVVTNTSAFPVGNAGMFKAKIQSGGRLSIPGAEREALGIDEGDIVQTFIIPIKNQHNHD